MSGTISERVWNSGQSWHYEHTFAFKDGQRCRSTIRRNAYAAQSFGKVERWDGSQWREVLSRSVGELGEAVRELAYVDKGISCSHFSESAHGMEMEAWEIVKGDES